jgi:hypothetical protein
MAPSSLPLRRTAVCLDCEACFPLGARRCPSCASGAWMPMIWVLAKAQQMIRAGGSP